jgi:dephospho-CoA kinase
MTIIGVTGGMGSGKSTALAMFNQCGGRTFDSDRVVRELYESDRHFKARLVQRWGDRILDVEGKVVRSEIGRIIFSSERERAWLESDIHPRVRARLRQVASEDTSILYAEIPLLFEVGWDADVTHCVAVWCRRDIARARLIERGLSEEEIDRRLRAQSCPEDKLEQADFAIVNNGSMELLAAQCRRLHGTFTE